MTAAFAAIALGLLVQERGDFTFRLDVHRVYVDVFLTEEGRSSRRLSRESFEVYDDGDRRDVELVDVASIPQAFAVLLDESGSIRGRKRELLQEAVLGFGDQLRERDELTVLSFDRRTKLRKPLGPGKPEREGGAYAIDAGGLTALNDSLFLAMSYLRNARGRPILVVFTDGVDNASWVDEKLLLESARLSEVVVYAIRAETAVDVSRRAGPLSAGGSSGESVAMLDAMTRLTGGRSIDAMRGEVYSRAFEEIVAEVNTRYILAFTPPDDARPGWHEIRVKVKGVRDADVRARTGYFLPGE